MNNAKRQAMKKDIKKGLFEIWTYLFISQLVVGGHAIYELADKYPDIGFIQYAMIVLIGAAVIAAILLVIILIVGAIGFYAFMKVYTWWEERLVLESAKKTMAQLEGKDNDFK